MMAAGWSVLFIAWPYLVDQVVPPRRPFVERTWYGLRFAVPALAGFLCLPFIARYRRRPVALAVAAGCLACASLASSIELQRVDNQRGDMLMAEALKQSDKYVWYGALFAAAMSLGAGLTVRPRPQTPRRSRSTLHGDASWMPMKQVARLLPETGGIVIGERYRVDRDDVPSTRKPQACSASGPHTVSLREPSCTRFARPRAARRSVAALTRLVVSLRRAPSQTAHKSGGTSWHVGRTAQRSWPTSRTSRNSWPRARS